MNRPTLHEEEIKPLFNSNTPDIFQRITVNFRNKEDMIDFSKLINQNITTKITEIYFPLQLGIINNIKLTSFCNVDSCKENSSLFTIKKYWEKEWQNMPEFNRDYGRLFHNVCINFKTEKDVIKFSKLINQKISSNTNSLWFLKEIIKPVGVFFSKNQYSLKYPVYIISKGRWESRLTSKALENIGVPYHIVIEPQEYKEYAKVIDPKKILVLPFSNLGQGGIPARNWVWKHSISIGAKKHWILDDNIRYFYRSYRNKRYYVKDGTIFRCCEDFTDRYSNVAISGMNYGMFVPDEGEFPAFYLNTRVYSCILIRNDIPYRWRGRYNEDTDLSIRALKDGWCTILFNAFSAQKVSTMVMKGGNTDELYKDDGRLKMAQSLVDQHPDIVRVTWKFNRWQHQVDYSVFKNNKLKKRKGLIIPEGINNYGMILKKGVMK